MPASAAARPLTSTPHTASTQLLSARARALAAIAPGGTWSWQNPGPNGTAIDTVSCPTAVACFAAGDSGPVMATTDGGAHWTRQHDETAVFSMSCGDPMFCVGVTANAGEITTTDGGTTWNSGPTNFGQLNAVSCVPGTHTCIGVGDNGTIAELTGSSVGTQNSGTTEPLFGVNCANSCYAVGYGGTLLQQSGFGWTSIATNSTSFLLTVSCGPRYCVAGGTGAITLTWDPTVPAPNISSPDPVGSGDIYGSSCPQPTLCMVASTDGDVYAGSFNKWATEDVGSPGVVWSLACPTSTFCLAAGDGHFIGATNNGGSGWKATQPTQPPASGELYAISCPSTSTCVAAGFHGARTADGGATWTALPLSADVWAISCPTTAACFAVGADNVNNGGLVFKTTDAGVTWTTTQIASQPLHAVSCPGTTTCFAGGSNNELLTTTDGTTWTALVSPNTEDVTGISCPTATDCIAITQFGQNAGIIGTTDGSHWTSLLTLSGPILYAIKCPTADTCYGVGNDTSGDQVVYKTVNGGATWAGQSIAGPNADTLHGIDCVSATHCFAVGHNGALWGTTDGSTWTSERGPYGIWYSVSCAGATTVSCFTVDFFGGVTRTVDNGATWLRVYPNATTADFKAVSCVSSTTCFAVTLAQQNNIASGEILSTADDGATWKSLFTDSGAYTDPLLEHISCPSTTVCFATDTITSAGRRQIVSTTDGGATWSTIQLATSSPLAGISCPDAMHCFVGDSAGGVFSSSDGGVVWTPRAVVTATGISGLSCPTAIRCFATDTGKPGRVYRTVDGTNWALSFNLAADPSGGSNESFDAISCSSAGACSAVGGTGLAATTTDGVNWRTDQVYSEIGRASCRERV